MQFTKLSSNLFFFIRVLVKLTTRLYSEESTQLNFCSLLLLQAYYYHDEYELV